MKIVVIGGSGLIGSKLVAKLREHGHEAVAASPDTGVNTLTGEGLAEALEGAAVVVDVSNSPSFEDAAVLEFFKTSTRNLLAAEAAAGVGHHVALSVVGTERLPRQRLLPREDRAGEADQGVSIPYSIVHATQFFEFVEAHRRRGHRRRHGAAAAGADPADGRRRRRRARSAEVAVGAPLNGIVEVAGPEQFRFDELVRQRPARAHDDPREVVADPHARYFGAELEQRTLVPGDGARLGETRFDDWLAQAAVA